MDASSSWSPQSPETLLESTACVPPEQPSHAVLAGSIADSNAGDPGIKKRKTKKKRMMMSALKGFSAAAASSSPSSSSSASRLPNSTPSAARRVACKRRNPRVVLASARRTALAEVISFRLGMSIAAFVAQILERKEALAETMSAEHLALICASAVRESLANDFGDTFDGFVSNFEKSFRSTFRTLKLIKESCINKGNSSISQLNVEDSTSGGSFIAGDSVFTRRNLSSSSMNCHPEELFHTNKTGDQLNHSETMEDNEVTDSINLELASHEQMNELTCVSASPFGPMTNRSALSTIEKSLSEQARSNDLKALELSLTMKKLKMKEAALALSYDSNNLERSKLAMGISKASFRTEKFKTQLEDVRHAELIRKCLDCLVAGLLLMAGSLTYGAYIYSYHKITEATASCTPSTKDSKSWWFPNPVATLNSGMQTLSCQFQVLVRMLFGLFMILSITYLLLQRSASSKQAMPITFMILLLALLCGTAGKFCVDTLGGSGYHWLIFWETICMVHFFCNTCTPALFFILYGPLASSPGTKPNNPRFPYWIRRLTFYLVMLLFLPLLCGLLPFAGVGEWKDHFVLRIADYLSVTED